MKSTCFSNLLGCCCNTTSATCQSDSCSDSQAQLTLFTDGKQGKITVWSEWFTVSSVSSNCHLANYSCAVGLCIKAWLFYWGRGDSLSNTTSIPYSSLLLQSIFFPPRQLIVLYFISVTNLLRGCLYPDRPVRVMFNVLLSSCNLQGWISG